MKEIVLKPKNGLPYLFGTIAGYIIAILLIILSANQMNQKSTVEVFYNEYGTEWVERYTSSSIWIAIIVVCAIYLATAWILFCGIKVLNPQEALVVTLFGKYKGTIKEEGIFFINPFSTAVNPAQTTKLRQSGEMGNSSHSGNNANGSAQSLELAMSNKKISLKEMTLSNNRQKINDYLGNPIEISVAVIWRVRNTAKAVFEVDNYKEFLSLQCDTSLRNIVRLYPYDVATNVDTTGDGQPDEGSLRGSSDLVAEQIRQELQQKVNVAGIEVLETKITYLAYAQEIAAAMLQRQQAAALIDAKRLIVDGAVDMVELALERLEENDTIHLDDERKAAMVSNLLVVLCSNKDSQPVVNTGSLY